MLVMDKWQVDQCEKYLDIWQNSYSAKLKHTYQIGLEIMINVNNEANLKHM